ncbi:hypothetical protein [Clostridium sp. CF012]|uniref:hypothetical protein n=1 Tax=Clostridium sp. CF012 TaxID=2843319 RepID=UPI001C0E343A|nr:hypothetical protein [Clostridium sp. CF012]MBU3145760.1 hypothetical protein [Clostridium sp. CF012]
MNKLTKLFEGQEVIIKTDKGNKLINLVSTAKSCGLVRNRGKNQIIRWDDVKKKLNHIFGSVEGSTSKGVKAEITYILEEIENTDDRNQVYMSSWLSKRLALECHSDKAMRYKNFLITMDEARENEQSISVGNNQVDPQAVLQLAQGMQFIGNAVQGMQAAMLNIETYVKDSIQSKDMQIEQTMKLVGLRAINTKRISDRLKEILIYKTGMPVSASSPSYIKAKRQIFKQFKVIKWEDIPVGQYNAVHAFIEEM